MILFAKLCNKTNSEGCAVAQVSGRPLAAKALVQSQGSPCGICGGQSGTETCDSATTSVFFLSVSFHHHATFIISSKKDGT